MDSFDKLWLWSVIVFLCVFFWAGAIGGVIQLWRLIF